jgi:hypothetical protein
MTRAHELLIADDDRVVQSAQRTWNSDRFEYVKDLSFRLSRDPERVAWALSRSKQGARILRSEWAVLGSILKRTGTWTQPERQRALDLLGVPRALRRAHHRLPTDADATFMARLVKTEMNRLSNRIDGRLGYKDSSERNAARWGLSTEEDAVTRRHRRGYEQARRDLRQAYAMLKELRAGAAAGTGTPQDPGPPPKKKPIPPRPYASGAAENSRLKRMYPEDEPYAFLDPEDREPKPDPAAETALTPEQKASMVDELLARRRAAMAAKAATTPAAASPAPAAGTTTAEAVTTAPAAASSPPTAGTTAPAAPKATPKPMTPDQEQKERGDEARKAKRQREKQARKAARQRRK